MDWYVLLLFDALLDIFSAGAYPGLEHRWRACAILLVWLDVGFWQSLLRLWASSSDCLGFLALNFGLRVV